VARSAVSCPSQKCILFRYCLAQGDVQVLVLVMGRWWNAYGHTLDNLVIWRKKCDLHIVLMYWLMLWSIMALWPNWNLVRNYAVNQLLLCSFTITTDCQVSVIFHPFFPKSKNFVFHWLACNYWITTYTYYVYLYNMTLWVCYVATF